MALNITYDVFSDPGVNDLQTNTSTPGDQLAPDVLALSGGGFVSAYNDDGTMALDFYGANHQHLPGGYQIPSAASATTAVGQPRLTELADGKVLVVWDDDNGADSNAGVRAAIYTAAGAPVAQNLDLFIGASSTSIADIDVAVLHNGQFIVTYTNGSDVFYRVYNSAGVQQGSLVSVNTVTAGVQADSQVCVLEDGGFAITWTDTNPTDQLIKCRIFNENGTQRVAEFNASPGIGDNTQSAIAATPDGGFALAYSDTGWTNGAGISLTHVSAAGAVGSPNEVYGEGENPDVVVLANGMQAVSWTSPNDGTQDDINFRIFLEGYGFLTAARGLAQDTFSGEMAPAMSALADGRFITSWQEEDGDESGTGISSTIVEVVRTTVGDGADDSVESDLLRDDMDMGAGDDTVFAGGGADTVLGGAGGDVLGGEDGDDVIDGGADGDILSGDAGADSLIGGGANDYLVGGFGDDVLDGGTENDTLLGALGFDTLAGGDGADSLDGGFDDDILEGGLASDTVRGGAGNDEVYGVTASDPADSTDGDRLFGGAGADKVRGGAGNDYIEGGDGLLSGDLGDKLSSGAGNDEILGKAGADKIKAQSGADTARGGQGSDTVNGGVGDDVLYANGDPAINGSPDGDFLNGAQGNDLAYGSDGADVIFGLSGKDTLDGGGGSDTIEGGSGKDVIFGNAGADELTGGGDKDSFTYFDVTDSLSGAAEDVITDLGNQDFIDLSAIDAKTGNPGNQAFTLVGAFSGSRGELVVQFHATGVDAGFTTIEGDVNGDAVADFTILAAGDRHNFSHFVL